MGFSYNVNVLNQKGTPAIYTDTFANRPAAGFAGRLFVANDTSAIYEDTGTAWVLIANVSSGAGTLQQVTTNGNTTDKGISISALGLSTNTLTVTSLTPGSVAFVGAADLITEDNANLFWDDTNNRLGINTNTPGNSLDVHSAGTNPILALNNTAGNQTAISFINTSVAKWRLANKATSNDFEIYNFGLSLAAINVSNADNRIDFDGNIFLNQSLALKINTGLLSAAGFTTLHSISGTGIEGLGLSLSTGGVVSLRFNSTNNRSYTYPNADGTVALTSDLSAYLPLGGGTLTGALLGTTANFSGIGTFQKSSTGTAGAVGNLTQEIGTTADGVTKFSGFGFGFNGGSYYPSYLSYVVTSGGGNTFGELKFATRNTGSDVAATVAMTIASSQNILIGLSTDDTVNKLQVSGSAYIDTDVKITTSRAVAKLNIDVNLNTPTFGIDIKTLQSAAGGSFISFTNASNANCGSITHTTATTVAYNTLSDYRLKQDLKDFNGIDLINSIKVYDFEWIEDKKRMYGVIAHEIQNIIPYAVSGEKDAEKMQGFDYSFLTPILTKAIQDQQKIIEGLIERIEQLEKK